VRKRRSAKVGLTFVKQVSAYVLFAVWIDWEATDDFHPQETDEAKDYEKNHFLDLRRPLLRQVWEANFRFVA
jgi:hypothetical protein